MNDLDLMEKLASEITLADFGPRLIVRNWDTVCASDLLTGNGIKLKKSKSFDNKKHCYQDGIHSPFFGTTWDDIDLEKTGWICLNKKFKIINPAMFGLLEKYIGATAFDKIIKFDAEMDVDGHFKKAESMKDQFYNTGIKDLPSRMIDIIELVHKKKKGKKEDYYWEIIKKWDCIFASAIPVYTSILRPIFTSATEYHYTKMEQACNVIIGCVNKLNAYGDDIDDNEIEGVNKLLYRIQQKVNAIDKLTFKLMDKKTGHIHDGIFGGRMDFSARDVIVPDPTLRANEIKLSYLGVLELYKLEIVNIIVRLTGCTFDAALKQWFSAHIAFSDFVYQVMLHLMRETKHGMICLINRNPKQYWGVLE